MTILFKLGRLFLSAPSPSIFPVSPFRPSSTPTTSISSLISSSPPLFPSRHFLHPFSSRLSLLISPHFSSPCYCLAVHFWVVSFMAQSSPPLVLFFRVVTCTFILSDGVSHESPRVLLYGCVCITFSVGVSYLQWFDVLVSDGSWRALACLFLRVSWDVGLVRSSTAAPLTSSSFP